MKIIIVEAEWIDVGSFTPLIYLREDIGRIEGYMRKPQVLQFHSN
jgi:hypothetical protein